MKKYYLLFSTLILIHACSSSSDSSNTSNTLIDLRGDPSTWSIPTSEIRDGGPGKDGIPSLHLNEFLSADDADLFPNELVIGVKQGNVARAYPHSIMNWHEIVNDKIAGSDYVISFCPLTGSTLLWEAPQEFTVKTFGVSGLLYNSNLILYDRETDSNWSQMLIKSVNGSMIGTRPTQAAVIETSWSTWLRMYPNTQVLSENTGFTRDYNQSPYGNYPNNDTVLFTTDNFDDRRLPVKERVLGISRGSINKVYPLDAFSPQIELINEDFNGNPYVVIGSSGLNFAIAFDRRIDDDTVLNFFPIQDLLPIIMEDEEGNQWDAFGVAVSGPREGQQLTPARSFIAYWFAWTAFYPNAEIHGSN